MNQLDHPSEFSRRAIAIQRACLLLGVLLAIAAGVANVRGAAILPEPLRETFAVLLAARPRAGAPLLVLSAAYWLAIVMAVAGIWRHKNWGFWLAMLASMGALVQAMVLGPHAYTGNAYAIATLSKMLWGAGLGITWLLARTRAIT